MRGRYKILRRLLALAYLVVLVVYLAVCGYHYLHGQAVTGGNLANPTEVSLDDLQLHSAQRLEDEEGAQRFVSTDNDPQLILYAGGADGTGELSPFYPGRVTFAATPHRPGGEIVAYYAPTAEDARNSVYSERTKLWAKQAPDKSWYFDFADTEMYALRIDPDNIDAGVVWQVERIVVNDVRPVLSYFVPTPLGLLLYLVLPGLCVAVYGEVRRIVRQGKKLPDDL